jgi:hypothetical protein
MCDDDDGDDGERRLLQRASSLEQIHPRFTFIYL